MSRAKIWEMLVLYPAQVSNSVVQAICPVSPFGYKDLMRGLVVSPAFADTVHSS